MSFYDNFYVLLVFYLVNNLNSIISDSNEDINIMDSGVETISPNSVGLILYTTVNNTSLLKDYDVELNPDECCLNIDAKDVCDVMFIEGECVETIPRSTTKVLKLVAPLIEPFERVGHCIVYLDSKPVARHKNAMRDKITITFDTRLKNTKLPPEFEDKVSICNKIDEDPMNVCEPVNCVTYYNGRRPVFDSRRKRCVAAPICASDDTSEVPKIIYDKNKNKCIVGKSISKDDIDLIKKLTQSTRIRRPKDILILKNHAKRPTIFNRIETKTNKPTVQIVTVENKESLNSSNFMMLNKKKLKLIIGKYFFNNRWTFSVLAVVIVVQCFLICTMFYCFTRKCGNCNKKKVERTFFNYRQDASVTTPLISTNNIDTDTTEFRYCSQASDVDNIIKCYKSCQKEKIHSNTSIPDDILSKCLTRRDWKSKHTTVGKSESYQNDNEIAKEPIKLEPKETALIIYQAHINERSRKPSNVKVNFENDGVIPDKEIKYEKSEKSTERNAAAYKSNKSINDNDVIQDIEVKRELKCHCYNYGNNESNISGFRQSVDTNKRFIESDKNKFDHITAYNKKSAQVLISSDSLDELQNEIGMTLPLNEDFSRYSFSSNPSDITKGSSIPPELSNKTSKNNVLKNVLSIFRRKSSTGPSSDPGIEKKNSNMNVQLIHMSKASMQSSYNGSNFYMKSLKQINDSTTSL